MTTPLPRIMVAPNGARKTKDDHPNLPITQNEIVSTAVSCFAAGAGGLHAHIRDRDGAHLLDVEVYRDLLSDLRRVVPGMALQITTEAVERYDPVAQMAIALKTGADMVSASVREIHRAGRDEARDFYNECADRGIAIQHILYGQDDCTLLQSVLPEHLLQKNSLQLLFVLGRYSQAGASSQEELTPFLHWLRQCQLKPDWAVCAFGQAETTCLVQTVRAGGKCRVGFENSLTLSDGTRAKDNAEKVADLLCVIGQGEFESDKL